ncbi:MAG: hypothetical protein KY454_00210 [Actinobacteria bacterium]|nr:hypothetical protein [Actinomycetota bacterium]MBW3648966.1 hypothetical protein [Actinomycetota bacterium]
MAQAQGYDQGDFLAVDDLTVVPGQEVTISGCCFAGGVVIDIQSTPRRLGTATADPTGVFTATVTIPTDIAPGQHTITVTGKDIDGPGTLVLRLPITVLAPEAGETAAGKGAAAGRNSGSGSTDRVARAGGGGTGGAGKGGGALARTGSDSLPLLQAGLALLLVGAGTVFSVRTRRNRKLSRDGQAASS